MYSEHREKMEVEYNLPESSFPRFQYTKHIRQGLAKRYTRLRNTFGCESMPQLQEIGEGNCDKISIVFSNPVLEEFPSIRSVVLEKAEQIEPNRFDLETRYDSGTLNTHLFIIMSESILKDKMAPVSLERVPAHVHVILIAENEKVKTDLSRTFKNKTYIHVSLEEHVRQEISTQLERYAFTGMKTACEFLDSLLTNLDNWSIQIQEAADNMNNAKGTTKEDDHTLIKDVLPIVSPVLRPFSAHGTIQKCHHTGSYRTQSAGGTARAKSDYDHNKTSCCLYQLCNENKELIETIERLNDEMIGMFNRSLLPKNEHPYLMISKEKNVNEKLLQDLQVSSPLIRSCGYRFSTFQVYVDGDIISDILKHDIKRILKRYEITTYSIVSSKTNLFANYRPGSKVSVKLNHADEGCFRGTLGGFARTSSGKSQELWVLMAKHVANMSGDGNLYINGSGERYAEIMKQDEDPESDKPYIDITAACVEKKFENHCDTRYITEQKKLVKGRLSCFDPSKLRGLPVHIRGASTNLGLGTVTVTKKTSVQDHREDENYIVVEDRDSHDGGEKVSFCKEGDSGAIVCADCPENYDEEVQLISVVSGEDIYKKGSYSTVRLDRGIDELENALGKKFNLC